MKSKTSQRTVYIVTAVIVASMVGGFALAELSLGGTSTSYQGSHTTSVQSLTGLTWQFTQLSVVNTSSNVVTGCGSNPTHACDVFGTSLTICAGYYPSTVGPVVPCNSGDFIEQMNLTTTADMNFTGGTVSSLVSLTVFVTGTPFDGTSGTYAGAQIWFIETGATPLANPAENIALLFDIGSLPNGPGSVTSVSVIATT